MTSVENESKTEMVSIGSDIMKRLRDIKGEYLTHKGKNFSYDKCLRILLFRMRIYDTSFLTDFLTPEEQETETQILKRKDSE